MDLRIYLTCSLLLVLASQPLMAEDRVSGTIVFESSCPGDRIQDSAEEALVGPLLTAILTGVVSQGLKMAGDKLSEAAQEKNVDVIHRGSHFYAWKNERLELRFGCLIVASKGTKDSKRTLEKLVADYRAMSFRSTADGLKIESIEDGGRLLQKLKDVGFSDSRLPGILAVFDVELSAQKDAARLVPRFVVMDHSIREKRVDGKERTMTFEVSLSAPQLGKSFAQLLVKFEKLVIGQPFKQDPLRPITSSWFPLPTADSETVSMLKSLSEKKQVGEVELQTAKLAGYAAIELGNGDIRSYLDESPPCPSYQVALTNWISEYSELEKEKAKPKEQQTALARLTNAELYYKSCYKYLGIRAKSDKDKESLSAGAGAFDVTVIIKEFRERPFAEFFGGVLGDNTTRSGLTSALVGAVDPAAQAKEEKKRQEDALAARLAYEQAIVAAEIATATYENATSQAKAAAYVDMEAKKRTANRQAEALGLPAPYPESGVWFG